MASAEKDESSKKELILEGSLSAYEVADIKEKILDGLNQYEKLVINIDGVTACDTLGVQLLFSAFKTARSMKKKFLITGNSNVCWEAASGIGLDPEDYISN